MSTVTVLEPAGDAIVIVDATGIITDWNRAATSPSWPDGGCLR